jgi:signal transduction histidine kinase
METLVEHLRKDLEPCQAHLEIRDLPEIMGDPTQISLLFQILLENALQYARPGVPPHIRIEAEPNHTIAVDDNGRGFDEAYLASIMRPFKRLVTKSDVRGAGLGLSLAKRIVECHGGELSASSEPGRGSQFRIRFPHRDPNTASPHLTD